MLKERQLQHLPAATAATAVVARPSRRRVLIALQALPLQALHLAYEAGPCATYDVHASCLGQQTPISGGGLIHQQQV